jgi:hypothetical protein
MLARSPLQFLFLFAAMLGILELAQAQEVPADTLARPADTKPMLRSGEIEEIAFTEEQLASLPDPRKAAFLSAVLPGMGQVYNGALWKVPLVYAGGISFVYAVNFYNQRYGESLRTLRLILYEPNAPSDLVANQARYQREANFYRRNRDYLIILGGAFYGLQIVEAYVDAHLQSFDLSEDLSLRLRPTLLPDPSGTLVAGLRITYTFP